MALKKTTNLGVAVEESRRAQEVQTHLVRREARHLLHNLWNRLQRCLELQTDGQLAEKGAALPMERAEKVERTAEKGRVSSANTRLRTNLSIKMSHSALPARNSILANAFSTPTVLKAVVKAKVVEKAKAVVKARVVADSVASLWLPFLTLLILT